MKINRLYLTIFFLLTLILSSIQSHEIQRDKLFLIFDNTDYPPHYFCPYKLLSKPKIGLALSGGGARGLAQIGVLQILEENDIHVDFIVGVSIGALVGGLYAGGYSPFQIQDIVKQINWEEIIIDTPPRSSLFIGQKEERDRSILQIRFRGLKPVLPQAITAGQKLSSILTDLTMRMPYQSSSNFDNLKVPFRALTCDMVTGGKVLIKEGDLAEAMRASATFPLLFSPVQKDSMLLVDGGLINNIPVDEVKESDVDIVIAVNTISKLHEKNRLHTPWIIADQVTTIMQREKSREQQEKADILIQLNMEERKSENFKNIDTLIIAGRKKAAEKIDLIKSLSKLRQKNQFPNTNYIVNSFDVINCSTNIKQEIIKQISPLKTELSQYEIYTILEQIYQMGIFSNAFAEIMKTGSILFHVEENPKFDKIVIEGNSIFPDSVILQQISSVANQPINYYQSKQDLENIIELYRKNGYSLAQIKKVELYDSILKIQIDEGTISDITIKGNFRTQQYVILREFPLKKGDIFNINKATEGINNIHSTDLFTNVSFEIKRIPNSVIVIIKLHEKPFSIFRISARYDLERKQKALLEIVDENFWGSGNIISFQGRYGLRSQSLNLQFRADRIFHTFLTYRLTIFHNSFKEYTYYTGERIGEYETLNTGFYFSVGQQIKRLGMLSAIMQFKSLELKKLEGYGFSIGKSDLSTIAIQSIVDTQDKYPFPTKGKYYKFIYEISPGFFFKSQESFFKIYSSLESYFTFKKRNTLHPKVIWATSEETTPFSEQFRLGGMTSFYGLHENEYIGRHLLLASMEYRYFFPFRIMFDVYWSIRYDLGAVWKNAVDIKPIDIEQGIGTTLSINTLLGPIIIAYGQNFKGKNVFYFSVGYEF